jgi:hypothetical protein
MIPHLQTLWVNISKVMQSTKNNQILMLQANYFESLARTPTISKVCNVLFKICCNILRLLVKRCHMT